MLNAGTILSPYINGRFVAISKPEWTFSIPNPARPGDILAVVGWRKDYVNEVVDGMKNAFRNFQSKDLATRLAAVERVVACLRDSAEEIKSQMVLELGRSRFAVEEEWRLCEQVFSVLPRFCTDILSEKNERDGWAWAYAPVGLVLISTNISLPVFSLLSTALPALVAGNAVALRPSLHCPLSGSVLASCIHQAGLPAGLVQIIHGDFDVFRRLALTHQFNTVLFTGSEESSEQLRHDLWSDQNTKLVICGAGKNAALVLESADLDDAAAKILYGACVDAGQRIESTSLAFVHSKVVNAFTEKFVQAVKTIPISAREDFNHKDVHSMGPLCSGTARERFLRFQGIAAREALETLRWGKTIDNPNNGFYVSPGVHLMDATKVAKSVYASNAFFGPDVAIVPVDSIEQATSILDEINAARVLAVHTTFDEEVRLIRHKTEVPIVSWNCATTDLEPGIPVTGRGHAGNALETGMRFILSTIYPKVINLKERLAKQMSLFVTLLAFATAFALLPHTAHAVDYEKAVEGNEVVKSKLYPRAGKIELIAPQGGMVLNSSFVDTFLVNGGLTYHFNEWHALNIGGYYGINNDRPERECIENFFLDPDAAKKNETDPNYRGINCDPEMRRNPTTGNPDPEKNNRKPWVRKPAYVPIREINYMFDANYQWTPVYGKALWFLSAVGYLDLYTSIGLGAAMTTYYPLRTTTASGRDIVSTGTDLVGEIGEAGRPQPIQETSPMFSFGVGNRFFFGGKFLTNIEFRNVTIFGTNGSGGSDTMNFFGVWGGLGVML